MWQTLGDVLRASWEQLARETTVLLPNLLAAITIVLVGLVVGFVAGRVTGWAVRLAKIDTAASRLGILGPLSRVGISSVVPVAARTVQGAIVLLSFLPALYSLDPRLTSDLVGRSLLFLPHLGVAIIMLWVGFALSRFLGRGVLIAAVNAEMRSARLLAGATRAGVVLVAAAVAFEHLGIGRATVLAAFAILFGGVTLATALAVGLGSQDAVRRWWAEGNVRDRQSDQKEQIHHL
jgi:hypothetical protein